MLTILQARLQQDMNRELPDVQAGLRKVRGTRDQIANIHWIIEKPREFSMKYIYFCFIDYKYINKVRKRNGYSLKEKMPLNGEKIQP